MKIVLSSYAEFKLGRLINYLQRKWNAELAKKYLEEIDATLFLIFLKCSLPMKKIQKLEKP